MSIRPTRSVALAAFGSLVTFVSTATAATVYVSPGGSIDVAIAAANPGDTVLIKKGEYVENVVVDKTLTLVGEKRTKTIIRPNYSNPNPCPGSSLCGGAASNIILVQASNVTIRNLTLDGDNPLITSGVLSGGVDVDARNGIITNHRLGTFNNLKVIDVTIRNVYLRGLYASSSGTFEFRNNEVSNVQGDYSSIAIFNFGGSGIMVGNTVTDTNDAIASNWSVGVKFVDNEVRKSASGIHTDNASGLDVIKGNTVRNSTAGGYGIWVFAPYAAVSVEDNEIKDVDVGLALFGQSDPAGTLVFRGNRVQGRNAAGGAGVFVSNDLLGWGSADVKANFEGNIITNNVDGFVIDSQSWAWTYALGEPIRYDPHTVTLNATCNSIRHNTGSGVTFTNGDALTQPPGGRLLVSFNQNDIKNKGVGINNLDLNTSSAAVDASSNWWGCSGGPGAHGCDTVSGPGLVTFMPWLTQPSSCAPRGDSDDDKNDKNERSGNGDTR